MANLKDKPPRPDQLRLHDRSELLRDRRWKRGERAASDSDGQRIVPLALELLSLMDPLGVVELKQEGGGPTYGRQADDHSRLQTEAVSTRVI